MGSSKEGETQEGKWDISAFAFFFSLVGFRDCASRSRWSLAESDGLCNPVNRKVSSCLETVVALGEGCRALTKCNQWGSRDSEKQVEKLLRGRYTSCGC